MAEQVQAALDQMVAPLKDLLDRGIFSEEEVRSIVSRRRESEYLLRRRTARKADFLRYIETEIALEKLRSLRCRQALIKQRAANKQASTGHTTKQDRASSKQKHIGDIHIIQHVHLLFVRMIRKFKSDVSLYLQHAAFCKQVKSFSRLSRIYSEAVQLHPKNVGLWIEAASHEYFGVVVTEDDEEGEEAYRGNRRGRDESMKNQTKTQNVYGGGSVQSARILLQRGLRVNRTSQDLWLQAFALELHFIQKLRGRQAILFPDQFHPGQSSSPTAMETIPTSNALPLLVFKNAMAAIPNDLTFRLKFLDLCHLFPAECVDELKRFIMSAIRQDFASEPLAWIAWADHIAKTKTSNGHPSTIGFIGQTSHVDDEDQEDDNDVRESEPARKRFRTGEYDETMSVLTAIDEDDVLIVLKEATERIPTIEMYLLSVQFAQNYALTLLDSVNVGLEGQSPASSVYDFIDQIFESAKQIGIQSPELVMEEVDHVLNKQKKSDSSTTAAMEVIESFCRHRMNAPDTSKSNVAIPSFIWIRWAELHLIVVSPNSQGSSSSSATKIMTRSALEVLRLGLNHTSMTQSEDHMILLLHLVSGLITFIGGNVNCLNEEDAKSVYMDELTQLFQQILILAPGQGHHVNLGGRTMADSDLFGKCSISQICLRYLRLQKERSGMQRARSVSHQVLFQHQFPLRSWIFNDTQGWKSFVDESILIESLFFQQVNVTTNKPRKNQQLNQMYRLALDLFQETPFVDLYRLAREGNLAL